MKIFYFNDRHVNTPVGVGSMRSEDIVIVPPQTEIIVDIKAPEGHIAWVKQWDNVVMISTCEEGALNDQIKTISRP
jgi:hypothetical protein